MPFVDNLHHVENQQVAIMRIGSILGHGRIFAQPSIQAQAHHAEESLSEDAATHLAHALTTVDEDNRHLLDFKAYLISGVLHLNLEAITLETHFIQWNRLKHATLVALESRRGVMHVEARHQPDVLGGEVTHQHPSDGPVHHIHATNVARAYRKVVSLVVTGGIQARKVVGVVTEVGVHLEDIVILTLHRPLESSDVSRAQSQFTRTLDDEQSVGELGLHQPMHDGCGAVWTAVINNQDVKKLVQCEDGTDNLLDVFLLIVRWNDDDAIAFVHCFIIL